MAAIPVEDRTPTEAGPFLGLLLVLAEIAGRVQGEAPPPDDGQERGQEAV